MNQGQKTTFRARIVANKASLRNTLKLGEGRSADAKEENFRELFYHMQALNYTTTDDNMTQAATIASDVFEKRPLEIQRPTAEGGAARKLAALIRDSSEVTQIYGEEHRVDVRLDNDQLKHQHSSAPIGTRVKGGGNRFTDTATAQWHKDNTMAYMAEWANGLEGMGNGDQRYHGQATPVGTHDIHYEGYCLMAGDARYVLFHCYPSNDSDMLFR